MDESDHNVFLTSGSLIAYWNPAQCTSLPDLASASLKDTNSLSVDPGFVSTYDLHATTQKIRDAAMAMAKFIKVSLP